MPTTGFDFELEVTTDDDDDDVDDANVAAAEVLRLLFLLHLQQFMLLLELFWSARLLVGLHAIFLFCIFFY